MADLAIRAKWQAGDADKGIADLARQLRELKNRAREAADESKRAAKEAAATAKRAATEARQSAETLRGVFRGVFGALTVDRAVQASWTALKNTVMGLAEETRTYARIQGELNRVGGGQTVGGLGNLFQQLDRASKFDETQIASAYENLISLTGDADKSAKLLNLTMDVAIDRRMDLVTASGLVAKAAEGETTALGRLFPNLKNLNRQLEDIQGTSAAADIFLQALNKNVSGKSLTDLQTAAGAWDELKQSISELAESGLKAGTGGTDTAGIMQKITAEINHMQDAIDRNPKALLAILFGGAALNAGPASIFAALNRMPGAAPSGGNIADIRMADDLIRGSAGNPYLMGVQNVRGKRNLPKGPHIPTLLSVEEQIAMMLGRDRIPFGRRDVRNDSKDIRTDDFLGMRHMPLPFPDRLSYNDKSFKEDIKQKNRLFLLDEWKNQQQQFGNLLSSTITSAFATGARDGAKAMLEELKNNFLDQLFSLAGNGIAMALFPGFAPGGIAGAIIGRGTVSNAQRQGAAIQQLRMRQARG